jgi:vacuolar-type H+-ATPase subunit D/Vma8
MAVVNRLRKIERLREKRASLVARIAKLSEQCEEVDAEIKAEVEYAQSVLRSATAK